MKTNVRRTEITPGFTTHEGAPAVKESAEKELRRTVSCLLLFEDNFYESGKAVAKRIDDLCAQVSIKFICDLAVRARGHLKLRHAPLYLMVQALKKPGTPEQRNLIGQAISEVIQRADELAEVIAIYLKVNGNRKFPRQLKAGVAKAFTKWNAYHLGKWNRDGAVKLKDALFISHAKPKDDEQAALWKRLIDGTLESPQTWEVMLSESTGKGKTKAQAWEEVIDLWIDDEHVKNHMAILRNLRNITDAGVSKEHMNKVKECFKHKSWAKSRLLPFRFIAAAKHAPRLEEHLGYALLISGSGLAKMPGRTLVVVDVSGSMTGALGGKTQMSRVDAASALAMLMREQSEDPTVYATAGDDNSRRHATAIVPPRRGFSLASAITDQMNKLGGGGIFLVQCMDYISKQEKEAFDRVIVITDEQDCDIGVKASGAKKLAPNNYIINVGVYEPALPVTGAGWTRISGMSERVVDWIMEEEGVGVADNATQADND